MHRILAETNDAFPWPFWSSFLLRVCNRKYLSDHREFRIKSIFTAVLRKGTRFWSERNTWYSLKTGFLKEMLLYFLKGILIWIPYFISQHTSVCSTAEYCAPCALWTSIWKAIGFLWRHESQWKHLGYEGGVLINLKSTFAHWIF